MKYSHDEIQKMLEPLFEYMKQEYPNNYKLIIEPFSAQLIYEHQEQIWLNEEFHSSTVSNDLETLKMKDIFFGKKISDIEEALSKNCCDLSRRKEEK